jgi:hypothetical protein
VDANNYVTEIEQRKENSHKDSFGYSTVEEKLFLVYRTKTIIRVCRTRYNFNKQ